MNYLKSAVSFASSVVVFIALAGTAHAAENVRITEFMAANSGALLDQDGDSSDWIEIQNAGNDTVNLLGWHLTDDPQDLAKWTMPATNLAPGGFLVVFASGKDRAIAGAQLHANFQLDRAGEYLALVRPDGATVAHDFAPAFPPQVENVAYGIASEFTTTTFVREGQAVRWLVPSSATELPPDWAMAGFNDTTWSSGQVGLGFDAGQAGGGGGTVTNVARGRPATQSSQLSNTGPGLGVDGNLNNFTQTAAGQNLPATWEVNLTNNFGIERVVLRNRNDCCRSRLRDITVRILDAAGTYTNFQSALLNPENALGGGSTAGPADLTVNLTNLTGGLVFGGRVRIIRTPDPDLSGTGGQGNSDDRDALSLAEVEVYGSPAPRSFDPFIGTDLESAMRDTNASAFLRLAFNHDSTENPLVERLTLRMKYDDGFIVYLNGVEVARRNAPATPAWNSSATAEHPDLAAFQFESIDLSASLPLLQEGVNVLAIQALNLVAADDDFLVLPELIAQSMGTTVERYFPTPTPGADNTTVYLGLVADTKFSMDRGFYDTPFQVAITNDTPGAEIRYTLDGSEPSLANGLVYAVPIDVTRTTSLRAAAFKAGYRPSNVDTHTYIFVNDVVQQTSQATLQAGFPASWGNASADYGMDAGVIGPNNSYGGKYRATIKEDLKSIPTLSIAMKTADLFGPNGIYAQSTQRGLAWERPTSAELIYPDGTPGFQVSCGLRMQGGAFRGHELTKKHSFHLVFKNAYGPAQLQHPVFGNDAHAADSFDSLVLRAGSNDAWAWGSQALYVRDSFGRATMLDLGGVASHEKFVHLYLNGFYWGLYNLVERPDAAFSSTYFGGDKDNWDALNTGQALSGDLTAWDALVSLANSGLANPANYQRLQGNFSDGTRNPAYPNYLDVENLIDYMIVNIYMGNVDWPYNNYRLGRDRGTNSTGFKFYMWDAEWSLGLATEYSTNQTGVLLGVAVPYAACRSNLEFRVLFGDHLQKHFFNGGALYVDPLSPQHDPTHPERNVPASRFMRLTTEIERAMVAESARWGDQRSSIPYTRDEHWAVERTNLLANYFPKRSSIVLQQFRKAGLYPSFEAPVFNLPGVNVPAGFNLLIGNPNTNGGTIFFTLDGSDPRLPGGAVAPTAQTYSLPVTLNTSTEVRARVKQGDNWSALMKATVYTPQDFAKLEVTEIMYHPPPLSPVDGDEFEFIELKNTGAKALNLGGLAFTAGITFTFTNGTILGPGQFFVLVRNAAQFAAKYPGVAVNGVYAGKLDNGGETIRLTHPLGSTALSVRYGDTAPWPVTPDAAGFSLVPADPSLKTDPDEPAHWRASTYPGGSPGTEDPPNGVARILINEVLTSALAESDAIELFNPEAASVDLGGWFLSDEKDAPKKYRFPEGTAIAAGGYLVLHEFQFNPMPGASNSFALRAEGDQVYLFSGDANTNLTGYAHGFSFGAAENGVSFGRHRLSTGEDDFPAQVARSFGGANAGAKVGPLVITEIMYHPDQGADEFIELKNITGGAVPLYDPAHPTNAWRVNGLDYRFPTNITLGPAEFLVLIPTTLTPAEFRAKYQVPDAVPILGGYNGALQETGERLELQRPAPPGTNNAPAYITVDAVRYNDRAPWPPAADGSGPSLQRKAPGAYGNDPINWEAALPTPGRSLPGGTPPAISVQPVDVTVVAAQEAMFTAAAIGSEPLHYQWQFQGDPIPGATKAVLSLTNAQPAAAGEYRLVVFNESGSAESAAAMLTVLIPAEIATQPRSQNVPLGGDVSFTVSALSTSPMTFQWRFNGIILPGETNPSLTVRNVQLAQGGFYTVVVTDGVGPVVSAPAKLLVLVDPVILQQPRSQTVSVGDTVTLSVTLNETATQPVRFRWRRDAVTVAPFSQGAATFTIYNVQLAHAGTYSVLVTNAANVTPGIQSSNAVLTVLADSDADCIPDVTEIAQGTNPNDPNDPPPVDSDGDGLSDCQERRAGTDPMDARSYLKIDRITKTSTATLQFLAVSNRTYTVRYTEDLTGGAWTKLANVPLRSTNRLETVVDPSPASRPRFYRLVTPQQP